MKKIFFVLLMVVIAACSSKDKSGTTTSFDEPESSSAMSSSSSKPKSSSAKSSSSSKPKSSAVESSSSSKPKSSAMESSSSQNESSSSKKDGGVVIHTEDVEGTFSLPYNPYSGKIKEYEWESIVPAFAEPSNSSYAYGFDRSPDGIKSPGNDDVVYISVEIGKTASFVPHLSKEGYTQYKLVNEDDSSDEIPLTNGVLAEITNAELANDGAHLTYSLYGYDKEWKKIDKRIEVLAYELIPKNFIYVQLDGDGWNDNGDENSFTKSRVDQHFNEVFGQAVVYANSTEEPASKYGVSSLIEVDMINPDTKDLFCKQLKANVQEIVENTDAAVNTDSPYWHIVFAINKERKIWPLENSVNADYELKLGWTFDPRQESKSTTYYMVGTDGCEDGVGSTPIEVEIRRDKSSSAKFYAFKNGKKVEFASCDILYTDNGYPVIPNVDGVYEGTGAFSDPILTSVVYDRYLPYGSFVLVPRGVGDVAQNILMHEMGHSFGLTDVERSAQYMEKEMVLTQIGGATYTTTYKNTYASSETNLMSWLSPLGKRVRYRNTPIVCTGGTDYYVSLESEETKKFDSRSFLGSLERPVENGYENQWECIRNCFRSEFATDERKEFWTPSGWCKENKTWDKDKPESKRRLIDSDSYHKLEEDEKKRAIVNYEDVK